VAKDRPPRPKLSWIGLDSKEGSSAVSSIPRHPSPPSDWESPPVPAPAPATPSIRDVAPTWIRWLIDRLGDDAWLRARVRQTAWALVILAAIFHGLKAAEDRGAFLRWRDQILLMDHGVNIYDEMLFPTPPIVPLMLYPLMKLPPLLGVMTWFGLKVAMAAASTLMVMSLAAGPGRRLPAWAEALVWVFVARPFFSDLHHANTNLMILFLVTSTLYAWVRRRDLVAGILLALAICSKVTPALFAVYLGWRWVWSLVGDRATRPAFGATPRVLVALGLGFVLFLEWIPSGFFGTASNHEMLATWWHRIIRPYAEGGIVGAQEVNQSMIGVLTRLTTKEPSTDKYRAELPLNLVEWDRPWVVFGLKLLSIGLGLVLLVLCRTRVDRRDDPRLVGEFALVALTMLFVSERSWKHHYVTLLFPVSYLVARLCAPPERVSLRSKAVIAGAMAWAAVLIVLTSSEGGYLIVPMLAFPLLGWWLIATTQRRCRQGALTPSAFRGDLAKTAGVTVLVVALALVVGTVFHEERWHKYAQGYGAYFWGGVVFYLATAWRLVVERGSIEPSLIAESHSHAAPNLKAFATGWRIDPGHPAVPSGLPATTLPQHGSRRERDQADLTNSHVNEV